MPREGYQRTEAVLFDYGLTLVSFDFPRECLLSTLERFRTEISAATGRPAPEPGDIVRDVLEPIEDRLPHLGEDEVDYLALYADAWRAAGLDVPADLLYRVLDAEQRCWDGAITPAPGLLEGLATLRDLGLKLAICSNAPFPPEMMRRQVEGLGVAALMDAVVFSSEIGRRKPAPELYIAALERVGVPAAAALYVGDRPREDYDGPRRLGMRAILCRGLARAPIPPGLPVIDSLAELPQHL